MAGLHRIFPAAMLPFSPYLYRNESIAYEVIAGPAGHKLLDQFTEKTVLGTDGFLAAGSIESVFLVKKGIPILSLIGG